MVNPVNEEWRDRAEAAEQELASLRVGIRELIRWLKAPIRGPIVFRDEVAGLLREILDR
jgi:hypothetical protein